MIVLAAIQRANERAGFPLGPQSQIDTEDVPFRARRADRADDFFSELREELVIRERRREISLFTINKDHVDVAGVIQFLSSKLSHPNNRKPPCRADILPAVV